MCMGIIVYIYIAFSLTFEQIEIELISNEILYHELYAEYKYFLQICK